MIGGRILDTSALVAAARGSLYMQALLAIAHENVIPLLVPATALADASAQLDDHARHVLTELVRLPLMYPAPLGEADALASGAVRAGRLPEASATAAHIAYLAAARQWPVITDAPETLRTLYPEIETEQLP